MSRVVVADLLTQRFNALGIKQTELASRLGVDPGTVNRWLKGGSLPHPNVVPLLAQVLALDERELSQTIMSAQRDDSRRARREAAEARSRVDAVLAEVRQIVTDNRDINDQIGRDIRDIKRNFKEMTKELRQVNDVLLRIANILEDRSGDLRSS